MKGGAWVLTFFSLLATVSVGKAQEVARVRGDVSDGVSNMRTGPGQGHGLVVAVPAGSVVESRGGCRAADDGRSRHNWCRYAWGRYEGWMSSGNVVSEPAAAERPAAASGSAQAPGFECVVKRGVRATDTSSNRVIAVRPGDRVYASFLVPPVPHVLVDGSFIAVDIDMQAVECEGSGRDPVYPVVLKGVEGRVKLFQEFGIQNSPVGIDANRSVLPRQPHKCFYIGDGHIGMELTARTYQQYAQAGFDSDTLCMVLTSGQIRFDPETGERLPTYVIADSDGSGGSTALGSELPFYAPSCFSRGRTRVERQRLSATTHPLGCTVNFHPWSGRRLSPQEVAFFTRTAALQAGGDAGEIMEDSNNLARDASRILSPGRLQAIRARAPR